MPTHLDVIPSGLVQCSGSEFSGKGSLCGVFGYYRVTDRIISHHSLFTGICTITEPHILSEFRAAWERGKRPDLEDYIAQIPSELRAEIFVPLIHMDVLQRRSLGEEPSPADYAKRFPSDQREISAAFNAIRDTMGDGNTRQELVVDGSAIDGSEADIVVGQTIGKYEIRSVLGVGGMGVVYAAYDTVIRRDVAIKLLSSRHSNDETALSRLLQEAQTAGSIHHPNIVAIYDVLERNDTYLVVMEKVDGDNLSELLKRSAMGRFEWKLATQIVMDCCDALSAAHNHGMIHRDIKPQNIMLTREQRAKLLDFGLAKYEQTGNTALTQEGTLLGTPDYMSPEQCGASEVTPASDIYSLGATYFALLTGHPPFASQGNHLKVMYAHCNRPVPSLAHSGVPEGCETVVSRAMAKQPEERYASAQEFKEALASVITGSLATTPRSPHKTAGAAGESWPWGKFAGAFIVLSVLSVGGYFWMHGDRSRDAMDHAQGDTNFGGSFKGGSFKGGSANDSVPLFRGIIADTIQLGTTTAYNGPSEELGRNMVVGMRTCFSNINDSGGVHGRRIKLTVLDDRYDPDKALANMRQFFEERDIFTVIGNVGTPTAKVAAPYASENGYLFFAPFSGASLLREDPPDRYVFNYRASYQEETMALVRYLVETLRVAPDTIAVFAQNDSYGDDGFAGVARAMRAYDIRAEDILRVGYDRNELDIDNAVARILEAQNDVRAVVMVPTYKVAARFVKRVKAEKPNVVFGAISFVGSSALAEEFRELGTAYADGVIVTQVVPPYMSNATGVLAYRNLLTKYYPEIEPGFVSLEGFIAAEIFVEGLRRAGPELTTEKLIDTLQSISDLDLGIGPIIQFSPSRHQASRRVWGTRLNADAEFEQLDLGAP